MARRRSGARPVLGLQRPGSLSARAGPHFRRADWSYVALEAEIPNPFDFVRATVGDKPIVVTRDANGSVNVFANHCAHRGVVFCRHARGNARAFMCPYHQWTYDSTGMLIGMPFRRGHKGKGGMDPGFKLQEHGAQALKVAVRNGVIFASFDHAAPPFEEYLGPAMLGYYDRVFDGRELELLGYMRQRIPCNWKFMFENIKDPYHATVCTSSSSRSGSSASTRDQGWKWTRPAAMRC